MYKTTVVIILVVLVVTHPGGELLGRETEARQDVPLHAVVLCPHRVPPLLLAVPPRSGPWPALPLLHRGADSGFVVKEAFLVRRIANVNIHTAD